MPYAVHITASTLPSKQPIRTYDNSRLYTMPCGRQKDKTVQIGSLEFLHKPEQRVLFHISDPAKAKRIGGKGEETIDIPKANVPDQSMDMVIMNPPFTCPTNHEGAHADVVIFHERIAGVHKHIHPIDHVCGRFADNPKQDTLKAWENILTIN